MKYSEDEKLKYVRGFKKCTLPIYQYAEKMNIKENDLKEWLKEYKHISAFGSIQIDNTIPTEVVTEKKAEKEQTVIESPVTSKARTILSFENDTIKIEIKENYSKELLSSLIGVVEQC